MLTRDEHGRLARDPRGICDRATFLEQRARSRRCKYMAAGAMFLGAILLGGDSVAGDVFLVGSLTLAGLTFVLHLGDG